eukprot:GILI01005642.1.p1 GENE.GILI01005642.1~~GILI01005642.1.p1  ORF type:complete len:538 (+),score=108.85 GILI01005642.1:27-1640(+)
MASPVGKPSKCLLDGNTLTPEMLYDLGLANPPLPIGLTEDAWHRVRKARRVVDDIVSSGKIVYGINTGFGKFESTIIPPHLVKELQYNLIRSHCAGVGEPLLPHRARMMMALRINVLAKGHSGINPENLKRLIASFNAGVIPYIPSKGTVGASGDLAPLSHLALGMIGEGKLASLDNLTFRPANEVLEQLNLQPIELGPKEGLALINGTQFISALGCEALVRARHAARVADVIAAMTYEALMSSIGPLNPDIHRARPHKGQIDVATRLLNLLKNEESPSEILSAHTNCGRVQDAYSIRCAPQVHGVAREVLDFTYNIMNTELNCATDNPLIFPDSEVQVVSGGNFHGEYPAKAMDILAIGVSELASISERRIERLNNPNLSRLPAFLVRNGGLHSGFMIAHCTAAALVSENKVLVHPASCDSISTSAAQEDHVSMGGFAARKAIDVVANVERVLAIELLCACQGIDLLRPLKTTPVLERVWSLVRTVSPTWNGDRNVSEDIEAVHNLIKSGALWREVYDHIPLSAKMSGAAMSNSKL